MDQSAQVSSTTRRSVEVLMRRFRSHISEIVVPGGCVSPRHRGAVTYNGHLHSFGSVEGAGRGEARRLDTEWLVYEEDQSDVGDPWLERRDQDVVGRVALRGWRTVRHRGVRRLANIRIDVAASRVRSPAR